MSHTTSKIDGSKSIYHESIDPLRLLKVKKNMALSFVLV